MSRDVHPLSWGLCGGRDRREATLTLAQLCGGEQFTLILPLLNLRATVGSALTNKLGQLGTAGTNLPHTLVVRRGLVLLCLQRGVFFIQRGHLLLEELRILCFVKAKLLLASSFQLLGRTSKPGFLRNLCGQRHAFIQVGGARCGLIRCGLQNLTRKVSLRLGRLLQPPEQLPLLTDISLGLCSLCLFPQTLFTHQRSPAFAFCLRPLFCVCRSSGGGRTCTAPTKRQVHQTLHDRTRCAAVSGLLPQTLNELLLRFVYALGNQVLRKTRRHFLRGFFTTSNKRTFNELHPCGFGRRGDAGQNTEWCEDFKRAGDYAQGRGCAALLISGTRFLRSCAGFSGPSTDTQTCSRSTTRQTERASKEKRES